jgi:hypothetical protein
MSEPIPAEIFIGGQLPIAKAQGLLATILSSGACKDDSADYPGDLESLLDCMDDEGHLHLYNGQANYGSLDDLEEYCRANRLSYDRYSDAKYEYDGIVKFFRPGGSGDCVHAAQVSQNHQLLVSAEELAAVVQVAKKTKGSNEVILQVLLRSLDELLDRPPPLRKFEVTQSVRQKRSRRSTTRKRR